MGGGRPGAPGYLYGENISVWTPPKSPTDVVKGWYCEVKNYPLDSQTPSIVFGATDASCNGATGHFTQIVWKSTLRVGCASATCPFSGGTGTVWVCEYAPGGNNTATATILANVSKTCPRQP